MRFTRILAAAAVATVLSAAFAQIIEDTDSIMVKGDAPGATVTVRIMTDANPPAPFTADYVIGPLNNTSFTYGSSDFLIEVDYTNVSAASVTLDIVGFQANYDLVYRYTTYANDVAGTPVLAQAFGDIGTTSATVSGTATGTYAKGTGTTTAFDGFSPDDPAGVGNDATRFAIGARSTPAADTSLSTGVTITATVN